MQSAKIQTTEGNQRHPRALATTQRTENTTALTWGSHGDQCDIETAMWTMGFRDETLVGQSLRTFQTPTEKHRHVLEQAKDFARGSLLRKGLLLIGPPGRGKTHIARGIAQSLVFQGLGFRYARIQDLIEGCKRRMGRDATETPEQHLRWYCQYHGLLIIDELGRTRGGEWDIDQVVYPLVDERKSRPTIWITNYSLGALAKKYDEAITSRLQLCTTIFFDGMDDWRGK